MTSVSGSIPNLIGGVSQQPGATRLDNTAEVLENAVCSVVTGLRKRAPFQFVAELEGLSPGVSEDIAFHLWERPGEGSRILTVTPDGELRVFRLDGTEETVEAPGGFSYLTAENPQGALGFCPVGDSVYVYNRRVRVESLPEGSQNTEGPAVRLRVLSGSGVFPGFGRRYVLERNGATLYDQQHLTGVSSTVIAQEVIDTLDGLGIPASLESADIILIPNVPEDTYTAPSQGISIVENLSGLKVTGRVTVVVENTAARTMWRLLRNNATVSEWDQTGSNNAPDTATVATELSSGLSRSHTRINNVLSIESPTLETWSAAPGSFMRTYKDSVTQFTNLPPDEINNRLVKVDPDPATDSDGYYVRYNAGARRWEETTGPDPLYELDAGTMPHILRDNGDGTWSFGPEEWAFPKVGDEESNPLPSFVGFPIEHMFLFRDRMVVLSDENVTFSGVGEYTNFFRTSVALIREDDRMDGAVTVPGESMVKLRSALAFDGNLYLFADKAQIKLEFNDASPGQFRAVPLSNFEVSPLARPALVGDRALFADAGGGSQGWARVREYRLEAVTGTNQAEDITRQIPRFIPAGVYSFATSTAVDAVHVLSRGAPGTMFRYDYYNTSEGRVQSAWNSWTVPGYVFEGAGVVERRLFVLLKGYGKRFLAFANIEDAFDPDVEDRSVNTDLRIKFLTDAGGVRWVPGGEVATAERLEVFPDGPEALVFTWNGLVILTDTNSGVGNGSAYPDYTAIDGFPYWTEEPLWVVRTENGEPIPGKVIGDPAVPTTWRAVFPNVDLAGDEFFLGKPVKLLYKLSPLYMRDAQKTVIHDGRLQIRYLSFMFNDTVSFEVNVNSPGYMRTAAAVTGTSGAINTSDGFLRRGELTFPGPYTLRAGIYRTPVATRGEALDVTLTDDGPFQCAFTSIEWEGSWRPKTRRMNR